jgi:hypothetical protein
MSGGEHYSGASRAATAVVSTEWPGYKAMDSPNGTLVRRCFRILNARSIGLVMTLADIAEEEFRVLELIEAERQEQIKSDRQA